MDLREKERQLTKLAKLLKKYDNGYYTEFFVQGHVVVFRNREKGRANCINVSQIMTHLKYLSIFFDDYGIGSRA